MKSKTRIPAAEQPLSCAGTDRKANAGNVPFGIYIHWPFCKSRCPYCDFYKEVRKNVDQESIVSKYIDTLNSYRPLTGDKTVTSIFFGGGTPSLIKPCLVEKLISHIQKSWPCAADIEISLEANPNTDTPTLFPDLKTAGVNRLSLGIQALNDADLKLLGRTHNLKQALDSLGMVLQTFDNHSADLIYARPEQRPEDWEKELEQISGFGLKHISLYQLTIEKGTVFAGKGIRPLEEDAAAEMYSFTDDFLNRRGYPKYEVSNFAVPGFRSRHNLIYWQGGDYIGIGMSAQGRVRAGEKIYAQEYGQPLEILTPEERAEELVIMGLRLTDGLDKSLFRQRCGLDFNSFVNQKNLSTLVEHGFLEDGKAFVRATPKGFLVLNKMIEELCS